MLSKKIHSQGQVSTETIVLICVVLVFMLIIFSYNNLLQKSTEITYNIFDDKAACLKLAFLISETYSSGEGSKTTVSISSPSQVFSSNRTVLVGSESCEFLANAKDYNLEARSYSISVLDGNIIFS